MFKLPDRMEEIWLSTVMGENEVDIAKRLNITRQAVSKAVREARAKITSMFLELAESLNIDIIKVNAGKGFMVARSRQLGLRVYAFYIPNKGIRVLFGIKPYCQGENMNQICKLIITMGRKLNIIHEETKENTEELIDKIIKKIEE